MYTENTYIYIYIFEKRESGTLQFRRHVMSNEQQYDIDKSTHRNHTATAVVILYYTLGRKPNTTTLHIRIYMLSLFIYKRQINIARFGLFSRRMNLRLNCS